jgi:hypothetical protein
MEGGVRAWGEKAKYSIFNMRVIDMRGKRYEGQEI